MDEESRAIIANQKKLINDYQKDNYQLNERIRELDSLVKTFKEIALNLSKG